MGVDRRRSSTDQARGIALLRIDPDCTCSNYSMNKKCQVHGAGTEHWDTTDVGIVDQAAAKEELTRKIRAARRAGDHDTVVELKADFRERFK